MESPGKYLKTERESRNLSLKEVSESTKIREHLLKAIEEDQYELISSPVYVKGFLNIYAKYLGLNPDDIILGYKNYLKNKIPSKRSELRKRMTPPKLKQWIYFSQKGCQPPALYHLYFCDCSFDCDNDIFDRPLRPLAR